MAIYPVKTRKTGEFSGIIGRLEMRKTYQVTDLHIPTSIALGARTPRPDKI